VEHCYTPHRKLGPVFDTATLAVLLSQVVAKRSVTPSCDSCGVYSSSPHRACADRCSLATRGHSHGSGRGGERCRICERRRCVLQLHPRLQRVLSNAPAHKASITGQPLTR